MVSGGGASLGTAVLDLTVDSSKFDQGLDRAQSSTRDNMKKMSAVATGVGLAGVAAFGAMAKSALTFDQNMREVNSLVGLGAEEFAGLKKETLEVSSAIGIEANQAVKGLYQAISAGVPRENVMTFMEVAGKAAIAGVTDVETSVDGLTTVINAFGLEASDAERVADVMFSTVKGGKTTFEELSASMFQVAPIASSMGIALEEVSAATATLTKSGVPTSVAMTQIRQAMVALSKPTADMAPIIEDLGFASGQAAIDSLGLQGALQAIREKADASGAPLAKVFGSVEAVGAVLGITGENAEVFAADYEAAMNSAGASTEAFNLVNEGAGRQLEMAIIQLKNMAIVIGDAFLPVIAKAAQALIGILKPIIKWMQENPKLLQTVALLGAGISVLLTIVGGLGLALLAIGPALPVLGAAFSALALPIGIVAAAIAGLAIIWNTNLLGIRDHARTILAVVGSAFGTLSGVVTGLAGGIKHSVGVALESFQSMRDQGAGFLESLRFSIERASGNMGDIWSELITHNDDLIGSLANMATRARESIQEFIGGALDWLAENGGELVEGMSAAIQKVVDWLGSSEGQAMLIGGLTFLISRFIGFWPTTIAAFGPQIVMAIGAILPPMITGLLAVIPELIATMADVLTELVNSLGTILQTLVPQIGDAIATLLPILADALGNTIRDLGPALRDLAPVVVDLISTMIQEVAALAAPLTEELAGILIVVIKEIPPLLITVVRETVGLIFSMFKESFTRIFTEGDLFGGLAGILAGIGLAFVGINVAMGAFSAIAGFVAAGMGIISVAAGIMGGVLTFALSPIGLIVLAIAGIGIAAFLLWRNWETVWGFIKDSFATVSEFILGIYDSNWGWLLPSGPLVKAILFLWRNWEEIWNKIKDITETVWGAISTAFTTTIETIQSTVQTGLDFIKGIWQGFIDWATPIWEGFTGVLSAVWERVWAVIREVFFIAVGILATILEPFISLFTALWRRLTEAVTVVWDAAWGLVQSTLTTAKDILISIWEGFIGFMKPIWEAFTSTVSTVWKAAWDAIQVAFTTTKDTVTAAWEGFMGFIRPIWEGFTSAVSTTWQATWDAIQATIDTTIEMVRMVWNGFVAIMRPIWDTFTGVISSVWETAWDLVESTWNTIVPPIKTAIEGFIDDIKSGWQGLTDTLKNAWDTAWGNIKLVYDRTVGPLLRGIENVLGRIETVKTKAGEAWAGTKDLFGGLAQRGREAFGRPHDRNKQHGGPVRAGQAYIVGERGPELFVSPSNGEIIDAAKTAGLRSGAGVSALGIILASDNLLVTYQKLAESARDIAAQIEEALPGIRAMFHRGLTAVQAWISETVSHAEAMAKGLASFAAEAKKQLANTLRMQADRAAKQAMAKTRGPEPHKAPRKPPPPRSRGMTPDQVNAMSDAWRWANEDMIFEIARRTGIGLFEDLSFKIRKEVQLTPKQINALSESWRRANESRVRAIAKQFGRQVFKDLTLSSRPPLMDTGGLVQGPGIFAVGPGVKEVVREPQGNGGGGVHIEHLHIHSPGKSPSEEVHEFERLLRRLNWERN